MTTVKEATKTVLAHTTSFKEEMVPLDEALGKVLSAGVLADRDFPPFNRVAMDGIAISSQALKGGQKEFPVEGLATAGSPQLSLKDQANCLEVMTGAVLPEHTDIVVRYEDLEIKDGRAKLLVDNPPVWKNVHRRGEDRGIGELLIPPCTRIGAPEIGVLATVGQAEVPVFRGPRTVILSTGDELVGVSATPKAHQIRRSNSRQIRALLKSWGVKCKNRHVADDEESLRNTLEKILKKANLLVLSGGVSKGKKDFVPEILAELGVQKHFHRVKQRPGKPFWFGTTEKGQVVFAFPGNPVSTFVCTLRYLIPWLRQSMGLPPMDYQYAVLEEDFHFQRPLTYFLPVMLACDPETGTLKAKPHKGQGSGDLANLLNANAIMELPEEKDRFLAGEVYPCLRF